MLFKKVKKDYVAASCCNVKSGDIVKYTRAPKPLTGTSYFVVKVEGPVLQLKNMTSLNVVNYDLNSNKFIF